MLNTALGGATTAPTLRPRIFAPQVSMTSTADVHRIRTACTTFVALTLARIRIPACAVSWARSRTGTRVGSGITFGNSVALYCASWPAGHDARRLRRQDRKRKQLSTNLRGRH